MSAENIIELWLWRLAAAGSLNNDDKRELARDLLEKLHGGGFWIATQKFNP